MKKWIFILAISLIGTNAFPQSFGLKGGVNFATVTGDDTENANMLVAFYAGVFYNAMINQMFSVQPELVFSGQGAAFEDSDDTRLKLNYLNLTPLFRYNIKSGFFAGTGPQFGFLLSAKMKDDITTVDFKEFLKTFDFAWAFAMGYEFANGFGFYGRYNLGIANIADDGIMKNSVLQAGLRYVLPKKPKR